MIPLQHQISALLSNLVPLEEVSGDNLDAEIS